MSERPEVVFSDLVQPGYVYVFPKSMLDLIEEPPIFTVKVPWREEIRQIVRDGIAEAFPDLVLPPKRFSPDPADTIQSHLRMAMSVFNPRSMVTITDV